MKKSRREMKKSAITDQRVLIDIELCKGCGLCVEACPRGLIQIEKYTLNTKGHHPARFHDPEGQCTSCTFCAIMCPDIAITVYKPDQKKSDTASGKRRK
jgi:2-oxoglutarate ferredoxin oxidoreductase subunit delta